MVVRGTQRKVNDMRCAQEGSKQSSKKIDHETNPNWNAK